ncbi:MAG: ferrous iron transport protein A [Clostridia bacterium]|nr:ferrous iron transport protein A [Clostridia bacterium]
MPLTMLSQGEECEVIRVAGNEQTRSHLLNLGVVTGAKIKLIAGAGQNIIIQILSARVAVNADTASKILVKII